MNVSNLISHETPQQIYEHTTNKDQRDHTHNHQYSTRRSVSINNNLDQRRTTPPATQLYDSNPCSGPPPYDLSPTNPPKNVAFELHFDGALNYRARLPMRVRIFPHDTTESIVTTVKNFYGLYEDTAKGVSFEDDQGNILIARYENFKNNMVVYVRVIPDYYQRLENHAQAVYHSASPHKTTQLDITPHVPPPQPAQILQYGQPPSRPGSRMSRKQSASPRLGRGQRSASAQKKSSRSGAKSHKASFQGVLEDVNSDTVNGYSSSDGGAGSVTSSRKARSEQLVSAEISLDNILEGNRRKRAKFESSELPLFVPPQVPAPNSISSTSPQRRSNGQENPSPFARPPQRTFVQSHPLQSPQSYAFNDHTSGLPLQAGSPFAIPASNAHSHRLRDRSYGSYTSTRSSSGAHPRPHGAGILPTPDPTIASCISDEDVALQLMRLGDASNISHGRTSASTFDDAFSGRADAASSATSESGNESDATELPLPADGSIFKSEPYPSQSVSPVKKQRKYLDEKMPSFDSTEPSGDEVAGDYDYDDKRDGVQRSDADELIDGKKPVVKSKIPKAKAVNGGFNAARTASLPVKFHKSMKPSVNGQPKKVKGAVLTNGAQPPISPASLPSQSRKTSSTSTLNFQHQLGADEDDLSSKPRCQRCRKSKKGCDRQRPCQRCKDAGIGIEGCVSEDEGNGRKGRYGRHMGVPVKKGSDSCMLDDASPITTTILTGTAEAQGSSEKSKKRKR